MNVYVFVHGHLSGQECLDKGSVKGKGHFVLWQQQTGKCDGVKGELIRLRLVAV